MMQREEKAAMNKAVQRLQTMFLLYIFSESILKIILNKFNQALSKSNTS